MTLLEIIFVFPYPFAAAATAKTGRLLLTSVVSIVGTFKRIADERVQSVAVFIV